MKSRILFPYAVEVSSSAAQKNDKNEFASRLSSTVNLIRRMSKKMPFFLSTPLKNFQESFIKIKTWKLIQMLNGAGYKIPPLELKSSQEKKGSEYYSLTPDFMLFWSHKEILPSSSSIHIYEWFITSVNPAQNIK